MKNMKKYFDEKMDYEMFYTNGTPKFIKEEIFYEIDDKMKTSKVKKLKNIKVNFR